jgi:hypothetical protein
MPETATSALPTHPQAGALAPVDPSRTPAQEAEDVAQRKLNQSTVLEYVNDRLDRIDQIDREELLEIRRVMVKSQKYYDGKQYGHVDNDGRWVEEQIRRGDIALTDNQYKYHIDTALMEFTRARTTLEVNPADPSNNDLVEAAKVAQSRIDEHRKRLLTPSFVQTEAMNLFLKTLALRYTYWESGAGRRERVPITEQKTIEGLKATVCAICAYPVDQAVGSLNHRCSHCGSNRTVEIASSGMDVPVVTGYRDLAIGEPRCHPVDPIQVTTYLGAPKIAMSPYLKWKQIVMRCVLEEAFPNRVIPSTGSKSLELQYQRGIERSIDGTANSAMWQTDGGDAKGGDPFEPIETEQTWLEPYVYAQYRPQQAQRLFNGLTIEAGQSLIEIYPKGMYVLRADKTILDMWPEDKQQKWSATVFGIRPGSAYGSGTAALHSDQDVVNMIRSLAVANANANAVPREFVNADYLEGGKLSNDPNEVIEVKTLPQGATIGGNVYYQAQGQGMASEVYGLTEDAKNSMQAKLGTFSTATGQPDLKGAMSTATGISILRDNAVGRMGPALWLLTEMDVDQAYQLLELEQQYPNLKRYKLASPNLEAPKGNLSYTLAGVRALMKCDVRHDLIITPTDNSWMPVTRAQKIQNLKEYVPFIEAPPEIQAMAADAFSIPMSLGGWSAEQREASRRLRVFASIAVFLEKQLAPGALDQQTLVCESCGQPAADPATDAVCATCGSPEKERVNPVVELVLEQAGAPVDMLMDRHDAYIDFYTDWVVSDEGREASKLLKMVVRRRTAQHYRGKTEFAKYLRTLELEAQSPDAVADLITSGAAAEQTLQTETKARDASDVREMNKLAVLEDAGALPAASEPEPLPS